MDQLLAKIKETQTASQQAEDARVQAQLASFHSVEQAHESLAAVHAAEHSLLLILVQQQQQQQPRARAEPVVQLTSVPEEPVIQPAAVPDSTAEESVEPSRK